jgi:hypothetical protein
VLRVYHSVGAEIGDIVKEVGNQVYPTVGTPLDQLSFGVLGSFKQPPPPPPPDPGGFPIDYVQSVMNAAWHINQQSLQFDGAAVGL